MAERTSMNNQLNRLATFTLWDRPQEHPSQLSHQGFYVSTCSSDRLTCHTCDRSFVYSNQGRLLEEHDENSLCAYSRNRHEKRMRTRNVASDGDIKGIPGVQAPAVTLRLCREAASIKPRQPAQAAADVDNETIVLPRCVVVLSRPVANTEDHPAVMLCAVSAESLAEYSDQLHKKDAENRCLRRLVNKREAKILICPVCKTSRIQNKSVCFQECGHVLCEGCQARFQKGSKCPCCRGIITNKQPLFFGSP